MAQVLQGIPEVVYFIDDILVTGCTRVKTGLSTNYKSNQLNQWSMKQTCVVSWAKNQGVASYGL